jgi:hypothetical protein
MQWSPAKVFVKICPAVLARKWFSPQYLFCFPVASMKYVKNVEDIKDLLYFDS